jgi:transcriptional regulator with XRE-family HTH domain
VANERLRASMHRRKASVEAVAGATGVDPKTVHRWLGGRVPHPRHRWTVAKLLHEDEEFLWPGAHKQESDSQTAGSEVVNAYAYRSDLPISTWWAFFERATQKIDLLGYTLYFLPMQHPQLVQLLREKCLAGCAIRAVIAHPESRHVLDRDTEEDLAMTLGVRIRTTMKYFRELADCPGFEMRTQDVPLYNSLFRFDDEMLATPHLHATPGSSAPLLQLRRLGPRGIFSRFADHFDSIWATTSKLDLAIGKTRSSCDTSPLSC